MHKLFCYIPSAPLPTQQSKTAHTRVSIKYRLAIFWLTLSTVNIFAHADDNQTTDPCTARAWCGFVAKPAEFDSKITLKDPIPVVMQKFSVAVPRNVERFDVLSNGFLSAKTNGQRINISVVDIGDVVKLAAKENCALNARELVEGVFMTDLTQKSPSDHCAALKRDAAAMTKSSLAYQGAHDAKYIQRGDLAVYTVATTGDTTKRVSIATHKSQTTRYLQILDSGLPQNDIMALLSTITYSDNN